MLFVKGRAMPPVSPQNATLQQSIAEAITRLRAQIRQDIAALYQAVDEAQQLVQAVQRERTAAQKANEISASCADLVCSPTPIAC
jgi:hypothetical protein